GSYTVTVTDASGCTQTQTITVTYNNTLTLNTSSTQAGCTVNNGTATANPGNGATPYSYSWSNGLSTQTVTGLAVGTYTIIVTDASGCTQTQTVNVTQTSGPTAVITATVINITLGGNTQLTATGGGTYSWSPSTGLSCTTCANPAASPLQTTNYCVVVTDGNGCKDSSCITINVEMPCGDIFIPNAFSPDDDGSNDLECVLGGCIETFHIAIYDRWGEKVFETSDQKICWDGMYKGKILNTAVFVYYMAATLTSGEKISKKGNISLIR
ncbi:MAG: T9SS type B sorting domain-containing protein, partial [Bacteroidetes bacterium]